jgi:hypothetical protein
VRCAVAQGASTRVRQIGAQHLRIAAMVMDSIAEIMVLHSAWEELVSILKLVIPAKAGIHFAHEHGFPLARE